MTKPFAAFGVLLLAAPIFSGQPAPTYKETVKDLVEGTVRGLTLPAFVADQHQHALATWKRVFLGKDPSHHESGRLLLYGNVPGKSLKEVSVTLERSYVTAVKALEMERDEPWAGKIAVFFVNDRSPYISFVRVVEQRRVEEGETGSFWLDPDAPYVVAAPPHTTLHPPLEGQAGGQLAAPPLSPKGGGKR